MYAEIMRKLLEPQVHGYFSVVQYLVERGSDIHAEGDAALRFASANGHLSIVQYLIEKGAHLRACNDEPLSVAYENGHHSVFKYLESIYELTIPKRKK